MLLKTTLLVFTLIACRSSLAQEAQDAQVDPVLGAYQSALASLQAEKESWTASNAALQSQVSSLTTQLQEAQILLQNYQGQISESSASSARKDEEINQLRAALSQAQAQAQAQVGGDDQEARRLLAAAEQAYLPIWAQRVLEKAKATLMEIKDEVVAGDVGRLAGRAYVTYVEVETRVTKTVNWVSAKIDEHFPGAKAKTQEYFAQAQALIEKHITSAEWWKTLEQQVTQVAKELNLFIMTNMKKVPFLRPYADPVVVQLLVYLLFATPFILIGFALLALLVGPKHPASSSSSSKSKKKKAKATIPVGPKKA